MCSNFSRVEQQQLKRKVKRDFKHALASVVKTLMDRRKGEELLEVKRWEKKSPNTSRRAIFIANNYPLNRKKKLKKCELSTCSIPCWLFNSIERTRRAIRFVEAWWSDDDDDLELNVFPWTCSQQMRYPWYWKMIKRERNVKEIAKCSFFLLFD